MDAAIKKNISTIETGETSYIHGITLSTFLQLMRTEQKDCTLKVISANQSGYLYIRQGELIDAELADLSGEAAALEIIVWENVEIVMESTCQRNHVVINHSMEHILLDAFQRKDEQLHQNVPVPQKSNKKITKKLSEEHPAERMNWNTGKIVPLVDMGGLTQYEITRQRLLKNLQKNTKITEYVIFDQKGCLKEKNSGKCTISKFDPNIFTHLLAKFDSQLGLGPNNFLSFNTSSRYQYLLFHCRQQWVLIALLAGSQPQLVVKEIKRYVNS